MAYRASDARQHLLDTVAEAIEELGFALASLGAAYEQLDEFTADRLEEELFRPVRGAYGRARRTHASFADRHGLEGRTFQPASPGVPSSRARGFIDDAVDALRRADDTLSGLQDSMLPVEVGDAELRAGLADVREQIGGLGGRARELIRTLGR